MNKETLLALIPDHKTTHRYIVAKDGTVYNVFGMTQECILVHACKYVGEKLTHCPMQQLSYDQFESVVQRSEIVKDECGNPMVTMTTSEPTEPTHTTKGLQSTLWSVLKGDYAKLPKPEESEPMKPVYTTKTEHYNGHSVYFVVDPQGGTILSYPTQEKASHHAELANQMMNETWVVDDYSKLVNSVRVQQCQQHNVW